MKNVLCIIFCFMFILACRAEVIQAGITIEQVPKKLFGSWRISGKLEQTNAPYAFRPQSIDFWNLTRLGNIIELDNPMSGANSEIQVDAVEGNVIVFTRKVDYDKNKTLTDTVRIRLNNDTFTGVNTLKLETFSLIDGHLIKTQNATYHIRGEKIAGESIVEEKTPMGSLDDTSF